jgi:hypothetical protein
MKSGLFFGLVAVVAVQLFIMFGLTFFIGMLVGEFHSGRSADLATLIPLVVISIFGVFAAMATVVLSVVNLARVLRASADRATSGN